MPGCDWINATSGFMTVPAAGTGVGAGVAGSFWSPFTWFPACRTLV
jgi:hypothetical protein